MSTRLGWGLILGALLALGCQHPQTLLQKAEASCAQGDPAQALSDLLFWESVPQSGGRGGGNPYGFSSMATLLDRKDPAAPIFPKVVAAWKAQGLTQAQEADRQGKPQEAAERCRTILMEMQAHHLDSGTPDQPQIQDQLGALFERNTRSAWATWQAQAGAPMERLLQGQAWVVPLLMGEEGSARKAAFKDLIAQALETEGRMGAARPLRDAEGAHVQILVRAMLQRWAAWMDHGNAWSHPLEMETPPFALPSEAALRAGEQARGLAPGTLRELLVPYYDPRSVEAHACTLPPHRFGDR